MSAHRRVPLPELSLFAVTAAWGLSFVIVKWALESAGVLTLTALRMAIGLAVVLLVAHRGFGRPTGLELRAGALGGALLAGGYLLQTAGLTSADAGKSGFLTAFYVALVPAFEAMVYRRMPPLRDLAILGVSCAGIAVMVVSEDLTLSLGEALVAGAALCWAAQIVVVGRVAARVSVRRFTAIQLATVTLVASAGLLAVDEPPVRWSGAFVAHVLFLGVGTCALGFLVQTWGQRLVPPTRTAILFSGEPVFAAMFGVWLMDDAFGVRDLIGASIVMAAVAATLMPRASPSGT